MQIRYIFYAQQEIFGDNGETIIKSDWTISSAFIRFQCLTFWWRGKMLRISEMKNLIKTHFNSRLLENNTIPPNLGLENSCFFRSLWKSGEKPKYSGAENKKVEVRKVKIFSCPSIPLAIGLTSLFLNGFTGDQIQTHELHLNYFHHHKEKENLNA